MVRFAWDERKRARNLARHGFDFVDASDVFDGFTYTFEDDRFDYAEQRFVTLGALAGGGVSIVHTETAHVIRIISLRKATRREQAIYYAQIRN